MRNDELAGRDFLPCGTEPTQGAAFIALSKVGTLTLTSKHSPHFCPKRGHRELRGFIMHQKKRTNGKKSYICNLLPEVYGPNRQDAGLRPHIFP